MMGSQPALLSQLREEYHCKIRTSLLGLKPDKEFFTNADIHSKASVAIAGSLARRLGCGDEEVDISPQEAGSRFSLFTSEFIQGAFALLEHLRPGKWAFSVSQAKPGIAAFDQYEHLYEITKMIGQSKELASSLGMDYLITPDITVSREPLEDEEINISTHIVNSEDEFASRTPLRAANLTPPRGSLLATVSCKWTIRSDRAQNTRTEALNLIRNRKGGTPKITVVVMEPLPTRIASIALGTGDIDCAYHAALNELVESVAEYGDEGQLDMMNTMVNGRRLRDISDLPFDLII